MGVVEAGPLPGRQRGGCETKKARRAEGSSRVTGRRLGTGRQELLEGRM